MWTEEEMMRQIVEAVDRSNLTYHDVASRSGIPEVYLRESFYRLRWGSLNFPDDFQRICKALNLSADDLLGLQER